MQTKLLTKLLEDLIEINRTGNYRAAFRYLAGVTNKEELAVDIYKNDVNYYHLLIDDNEGLKKAINDVQSAIKSKTKYRVFYQDNYMMVNEFAPSEAIAAAKAFKLKQQYNINATIEEVADENL